MATASQEAFTRGVRAAGLLGTVLLVARATVAARVLRGADVSGAGADR